MSTKIPWSRLVAEGTVIVLSILLAFAIDASWAARAERVREATVLEGLARDFERSQAVLAANTALLEARLEAADRLLGYVGPQADAAAPDIESTLATVGMVSAIRFQSGTLDALLGSEGLTLLRDQALRLDLANWSHLVTDLDFINEFLVSQAYALLDYLRTRYPIQDMDIAAGIHDRPPSGFETNLTEILRDIEFSNNVYQQRYATEVTLSYLGALAGVAREVLRRIEG